MYYKSVNRGLMFTKAGVYCIGYVMALGLLAIISGVNALYLFLSTGMALLIVSGLLSERVMRYNEISSLEEKTVNAETAFTISFAVSNQAAHFTTFGIDSFFLLQRPKARLISGPVDAPIVGRATKIRPGETQSFKAHCRGMPRGWHTSMLSYQRTGYPFGFIEKFKFKQITCQLTIAPAIDQNLLKDLTKNLATIKKQHEDQMDFFGHRNYSSHDSLRHVDWRRSASKSPKDWVVKQYRSEVDLLQFCVRVSSADLKASPTADEYEQLLMRARTAVEAVQETGFQVVFILDSDKSLTDIKGILRLLAGLPAWQDRNQCDEFLADIEFATAESTHTSILITRQGFEVISSGPKGRAS